MLIDCPSCHARYRLDASLARAVRAAGRPVRCRRCGRAWRPYAPAPGGPRRRRVAAAGGLVLFLAGGAILLAAADRLAPPGASLEAGGAGAAAVRAPVRIGPLLDGLRLAALPPPALRLGAEPLLVLPRPPESPLAFAEAVTRPGTVAEGRIWDVRAVLRNPTESRARVPPLEIRLLAKDGTPIARQRIPPPAEALGPGEALEMTAAAVDPGGRARRVVLRLQPVVPGRP